MTRLRSAVSRLLPLRPVVELTAEERARSARRSALIVLLGILLFTVVYAVLSWLKYRAYMDARFDLGNMVQAVYNTAHGNFLEITTGEAMPRQISRLGSHVDPILAVFALPWLIWPSPVMLLVGQAAVVGAGAWPMYRLGERITRSPRAGVYLAGAYLLFPATGFLVLNEFHPVALATPLLLWAFLHLEEGRWPRALVFLVAAALCKETIPLVIGMMGVFFAIRKRSWRPLLVTVGAAVYFAVAVWVVIPHFNGGASAFIARYGHYGSGPSEIVRTAITDPVRTVVHLCSGSNVLYWVKLLWPFAGVPLFSPLALLVSAPELLLNGLSETLFQRDIRFHYTAAEIPFICAAAVFGLMRLWRWLGGGFRKSEKVMAGQRLTRETLALGVLLFALAGNYFMGPLPFSLPGSLYSGKQYARNAHVGVLDEAVALIPRDVPISANNNVGAQLSDRRVSYVFPCIAEAEWVIVDQQQPYIYDRKRYDEHANALTKLTLDKRFRIVFAKDGVVVFRRAPVSVLRRPS